MEAVVRGTKTIEEFKRVREDMLKRAERYSRKHIASCENWREYREECFALPFFLCFFLVCIL